MSNSFKQSLNAEDSNRVHKVSTIEAKLRDDEVIERVCEGCYSCVCRHFSCCHSNKKTCIMRSSTIISRATESRKTVRSSSGDKRSLGRTNQMSSLQRRRRRVASIDTTRQSIHLFLLALLVLLLLKCSINRAAGSETLLPLFSPTRIPLNRSRSSLDPQVAAGSSAKFTRTNELDVFLDEMNHNELRSVASGQLIDDLFKPKAANQVPKQVQRHHQDHNQKLGRQQVVEKREKQPEVGGLEQSQSEQQVYSECALILQRTYVKNIDDPKHQLVPFGKTEQACISYKNIDKAIEQAKHRLKFRQLAKQRKKLSSLQGGQTPVLPPFEVIHSTLEPPEDLVAAIGEVSMATTQILADQFDLSNDELLNGLPLIDMSKTKFWPLCPLLVKQDAIKCELTRFRTFTGHCNNLKHPTWGAAMTPFARYLPPIHPDGIWIPRKSIVTEITFHLSEGHHETHAGVAPSVPQPFFHHGDYRKPDSYLEAGYNRDLVAARSIQFTRHVQPPSTSGGPTNSPQLPDHYQQSYAPARASLEQQPFAAASAPHIARKSRGSMPLELPSPRLVTSVVHRDVDLPNHDFSILFMSWGQLLDHDMTRAAQPPSSIKCCNQQQPQVDAATGQQPMKRPHKLCLPIQVPASDPFYGKFGVKCLEFRRTLAGIRPNCVLGPRVHQNAITSPIDANFVYGSSRALADALRLFKGGRLRDRDWFKREGLKPILPAQDQDPDLECIARPKDLFCFLAGDVRANEQTHLTVLHTLYMREHNRMADRLAELNPHWDDERIYQETRHIMAAGVQHVMINEYIPLLIGKKMAELYNLTAQTPDMLHFPSNNHHHHLQSPPLPLLYNRKQQGYWHGYDPSVTTSVANSFAAAAFRQGHTFVQGSVERYNKFHEFVASEKLRHLFKQPFLMYQPGVIDELTSGMINQPAQSYDPFISEDISGHLFQPPNLQFGHDLPAINLQRGREQGLPGYNLFREWCGLPRAETFEQLEPYLTNHTAYQYSRLYKHVDDIDLWSGGVSERKLPGAAIGPTFACIIARQFSNTRRGDRFWYENPGLPSSFTPEQLAEIRKITLAKILCANSDDLQTIQRWALRMAHPVLNPRVPCHELPEVNLDFWREE